MLVSHRHQSLTSGTAVLQLDRAIAPTFMLRRVTLPDVVQDERVTSGAFGGDTDRPRRRLVVILEGTSHEFVGSTSVRCEAGDGLFIPEGSPYASRSGDVDALEIEWDVGSLEEGRHAPSGRLELGARARRLARQVGEHLRWAVTGASVVGPLAELLDAINAAGTRFLPDAVRAAPMAPPTDQILVDEMDRRLSRLDTNPMLCDLEVSLTQSRRTLTRNIARLHERYALVGRGGGRWRSLRDTYRLLIATLLLSQRSATPREVAGLVGYGSVEALDHALRHAALPSPTALQRAILAA